MKTITPGPYQRLKREIRQNLRDQLDAYLTAKDEPHRPEGYDGVTWTLMDSLCLDILKGAGIMLSIHTRFPEEQGHVMEDPSVTEQLQAPPSLIIQPDA